MKSSNVVWGVFATVYAALWLGGVVACLSSGGLPIHAHGMAPLLLTFAGLWAIGFSPSAERPILLVVAIAGFAVEVIGVSSGFPFGRYQYTPLLSPHWGGVPLVMVFAWLVLFGYVRQMACPPLAAAAWLTSIDLVIDPLAANRLGCWVWESTGPYYGIPWSNFGGWFAVSLLLFTLAKPRITPDPCIRWIGFSAILFFTVAALGTGLWLAGAIGIGLILLDLARAARGTLPGFYKTYFQASGRAAPGNAGLARRYGRSTWDF